MGFYTGEGTPQLFLFKSLYLALRGLALCVGFVGLWVVGGYLGGLYWWVGAEFTGLVDNGSSSGRFTAITQITMWARVWVLVRWGVGETSKPASCKPAFPRGDTWVQIPALPQGDLVWRWLVVGCPYYGSLIGVV